MYIFCNFSSIIYRYHAQAHKDDAPEEKRGKYERSTTLKDTVTQDIMLYRPTNSHYRREHAPYVLYLPSDLSARNMYKSFNERQSERNAEQCSYSFYCKMLRELNIKFTQLGHEECERCHAQNVHETQTGHSAKGSKEDEGESSCSNHSTCQLCLTWKDHLSRAVSGREEYDSDRSNVADAETVFSVDL